MNISVSQGEKADSDGTQGSFTNAVEGTQDSDGDQTPSIHNRGGRPQDKPHTRRQVSPLESGDAYRRHRRRNRHHWCPARDSLPPLNPGSATPLGQLIGLSGMTVGAQLRPRRWGQDSTIGQHAVRRPFGPARASIPT